MPSGDTYSFKVAFLDDKRFRFDGKDRLARYWQDLRIKPRGFSSNKQGGASLMGKAAGSFYGQSELVCFVCLFWCLLMVI